MAIKADLIQMQTLCSKCLSPNDSAIFALHSKVDFRYQTSTLQCHIMFEYQKSTAWQKTPHTAYQELMQQSKY